jgi:hypothetical protein
VLVLTKKNEKKEFFSPFGDKSEKKERNRRIFDHKEASSLHLSTLIKEAIQFQGLAWNKE